MLDTLARDLRYAIRRLAANPAFTIVASLSLALGIGANTAAFSVLYAVMLRALPVDDPSSLVGVSMKFTGPQRSMSYPAYQYLRDHAASLDGLVAFRDVAVNVSTGTNTERVSGMLVSGNYFDVLGVPMLVGSPIAVDDDRTPLSGGPRGPVAVLGYELWRRRFNRDVAVVGRVITIDGASLTIVGVAPPGFHGTRIGSLPDVYLPMMFAQHLFGWPNTFTGTRNNWLRLIGRLRPGVTLDQARADMTTAFRRFNQDFVVSEVPTDAARQRLLSGSILLDSARSGLFEMNASVRPSLFILMGLVALVLSIACVNVANLLVARAERYHRETAIHIALGASRARLWSQHLMEAAVLGAIAVVAGVLLAGVMRGLLVQLVPARQELDLTMDRYVLGLSLLLGGVTTIGLGLVTGWRSARVDANRALKGEDITTRVWLRKALIVGQLALSVVVLVAAALFGRTLINLRQIDPGFERERILLASISSSNYPREQQRAFADRLLETVHALPGVASAALANEEPLNVSTGWNLWVLRDTAGAPAPISVPIAFVSPDYFATMGIRFVGGRDFTAHDNLDVPVGIVNERFVKRYLAGANPVGTRIRGNGTMVFEIVGVVKDSASRGLRRDVEPVMYVPGRGGVLHVRTTVPPATLAASLQAAVRRLDPNVPVYNVRTIDQQFDRALGRERTFAKLSSTFGLLALVLSAVGLYGVMAYAVSRRTKELGIRVALGAGRGRIVQLVLRDAALLVVIGIAIGVPLAYSLAGTIGSLLYGVEPADRVSLALAVAVLLAVAALAAWIPARRAARVDPLVALRAE